MRKIIRRLIDAVVIQLVLVALASAGFDINFTQASAIADAAMHGDMATAEKLIDAQSPVLGRIVAFVRGAPATPAWPGDAVAASPGALVPSFADVAPGVVVDGSWAANLGRDGLSAARSLLEGAADMATHFDARTAVTAIIAPPEPPINTTPTVATMGASSNAMPQRQSSVR